MILKVFFILTIFISSGTICYSAVHSTPEYYEVCDTNYKIIDGDTIKINDNTFRLVLIDTPESKYRGKAQYCKDDETNCGELAKQKLKELADNKICCVKVGTDFYNRYLGLCSNNNSYKIENTFNYKLVELGYAWEYKSKDAKKQYNNLFKQLRINAQVLKLGLFADDLAGFEEPKIWRKQKRGK